MVFRHVRPKYQFHLEHRKFSRLDTSGHERGGGDCDPFDYYNSKGEKESLLFYPRLSQFLSQKLFVRVSNFAGITLTRLENSEIGIFSREEVEEAIRSKVKRNS